MAADRDSTDAFVIYDPPTRTVTVRRRLPDGGSYRIGDATEAMWRRGEVAPPQVWLFGPYVNEVPHGR